MSDSERLTAEYQVAASGVVRFDLSARTRVALTGVDAPRFLNNLCTQDIMRMEPGVGREAFLLDAKGRIMDYVRVFRTEGSLHLDTEPGRAASLVQHLDRYLIREKVRIVDETSATVQWHAAGVRATEFANRLTGFDLSALDDLAHRPCSIAGVACAVRRCDRSRWPGFDFVVEPQHSAGFGNTWSEIANTLGVFDGSDQLATVLRIEAGLPAFGLDIGEQTLPQEVDRNDRTISFTKGCYIGQETVARLDAMGHVNKLLRGLIIDASDGIAAGARVLLDGKEVGTLGSSSPWPNRSGTAIALAVLRLAAAPGKQVSIETAGGIVPAVVSTLPFEA